MERAWRKTELATQKAIGELKKNLGLVNMDIIWTGALLVPLVILVALRGDDAEVDVDEAIGWMVLAAIKHRYTGASDTALTQDLKACRRDDPVGALLRNLRSADKGRVLEASAPDFRGGISDRGELFAAYVACYQRGLKSFDGGNVVHQEGVHRHHILPRRQFEPPDRAKSDVVANIAFILGPDNQSIGAEPPERYLQKVKRDVLESQCIPLDRDLWKIERAEGFWAERQELLAAAFNDFVKAKLPNRRKVLSND